MIQNGRFFHLMSAWCGMLLLAATAWSQGVQINEILVSNATTHADPQGQFDDWIELTNTGGVAINLAGLFLTDDLDNPTQWQFPTGNAAETLLQPGAFLLVWADDDSEDSGLHASFKLDAGGETVALFDADGQTLLDSVQFGPQTTDISYGRHPADSTQWRVMTVPTPGSANPGDEAIQVARPEFSHERGVYEEPFTLTLSSPTAGARILLTVDGTAPAVSEDGSLLNGYPIDFVEISRTMCVRALAYKPGCLPSKVSTHTLLFLEDVVNQPQRPSGFPDRWGTSSADYEMDPDIIHGANAASDVKDALRSLPALALVIDNQDMFGAQGIYSNPEGRGEEWERPVSVEYLLPDGQAGFQIDCGIRIQGGWFRPLNNAKKNSFRLLFKGLYGETKLRYPLFGPDAPDEFDTLTLRAGANDGYTWSGNEMRAQFLRDQFMRDLQRRAGQASARGTFVHLYINGLYWGLYNPVERPDGAFSASRYGGDKEDWDVFSHTGMTLQQGDRAAWNDMLSLCREARDSWSAYQRLSGLNPDGSRHPGFPHLLDLPNYIDYMIVNYWGGNWDWPWNNYWLARQRTADSTGFKFYCWDAEDVMLSSRSPLNMDKVTHPDTRDVGEPHGHLLHNPEYRLLFADHLHRHFFNEGMLSPGVLVGHYRDLADWVEAAILAESARWGDQHRSNPATQEDWVNMRDEILNTYLPNRSGVVLEQCRQAGLYPDVSAPEYLINGSPQHGGYIENRASLSMQTSSGEIWYTLDGSDPRLPGGGEDGGLTPMPLIEVQAAKRVLIPAGQVSENWKGRADFDDSGWMAGQGGVGYDTQSVYRDYFDMDVQGQMYQQAPTCYIRIPFTLTEDIAADDIVVLRMRYDDGFVAYLNGVEVARSNAPDSPAWNSAASRQNDDAAAVQFENFNVTAFQSYLRQGDNLLALHGMNISNGSSDFLMSAELVLVPNPLSHPSDDTDISPTAHRYAGPLDIQGRLQAKARTREGGAWSALSEAVYAVASATKFLRITEIMYRPQSTGDPDDPNTEYLELANVGTETIALDGIRFVNGIRFTFSDQNLAPQARTVLVRDRRAFAAKYGNDDAVAGQYDGALSNGGERIVLVDALGTTILDFAYQDSWYPSTDGLGYALEMIDPQADVSQWGQPTAWQPGLQLQGTPGY